MALVFVNGRMYFTKSIREGGRVTSTSYGPALSEYARTMVAMDRLLREDRQAERMRRQQERRERDEARRSDRIAAREFRDRIGAADSAVAQWHRRTRRLVDAMLRALDYHRHARGQWRRRRTMSKQLARHDLAEPARLVAAGDVRTLEAIVYRADSELYRRVEEGTLNRGGIEEVLVDTLGDGFPRGEKEALIADAALIRLDLAPPGSSPAETLMASSASVSWLEVRLLEFDRADLLHSQEPNYRKVEAIDRMLSRASARLERSLLALGKLKRLKLPVVMATQINVLESTRG